MNLLTALYQRYGAGMWDSPQIAGLLGLLSLPLPQLASIRRAVSAFQQFGPLVLADKLHISDEDAVLLMSLFYDAVVDGYREVLGVDLEA
jgi:hypothetical protein